jgi:hypothetical protein
MKLIAKINIILPIVLFILMSFFNVSEYFVTIMTLTLVIGWLIPYLSLILTGLAMTYEVEQNKSYILNILSLLVSILIIILTISILEKKLIIILVEYIIISIMNILNIIIYFPIINKKRKEKRNKIKEENKEIKRQKKANNGIVK